MFGSRITTLTSQASYLSQSLQWWFYTTLLYSCRRELLPLSFMPTACLQIGLRAYSNAGDYTKWLWIFAYCIGLISSTILEICPIWLIVRIARQKTPPKFGREKCFYAPLFWTWGITELMVCRKILSQVICCRLGCILATMGKKGNTQRQLPNHCDRGRGR